MSNLLRTLLPIDRLSMIIVVMAVVGCAAAGFIDSLFPLSVLILYVIPVAGVAFAVRGYWWLVVSVCAAIAWTVAQRFEPQSGNSGGYFAEGFERRLIWDAFMRWLVFCVIGFLISQLRSLGDRSRLQPAIDQFGMLSSAGFHDMTRGKLVSGPASLLLIQVERRVSAFHGRSVEHAGLVSAAIADMLRLHTSPSDVLARTSTDQFVAYMPGRTAEQAMVVVEQIRSELRSIEQSLDQTFTAHSVLVSGSLLSARELRRQAESRMVVQKGLVLSQHLSVDLAIAG